MVEISSQLQEKQKEGHEDIATPDVHNVAMKIQRAQDMYKIKNLWNSSIKKKLRQKGIDSSTHKPLSELDGEDKVSAASSSKNGDKNSEGSSELSFADNANKPKLDYPLLDNGGGALNSTQHEFFLNRLVASSHESSAAASCKPSDLSGFLSFQQLNYGPNIGLSMNLNASIFFNSSSKPSENIISDHFGAMACALEMIHTMSLIDDNLIRSREKGEKREGGREREIKWGG